MKLLDPSTVKRLLRSPRVIVAELVALAVAGGLGAAMPQSGSASAQELAAGRPGGGLATALLNTFALDHVFRSPWFLALTLLAACSLSLVVLEQLKRLRRLWSQSLTESYFRNAPLRAEFERPAAKAGMAGRPAQLQIWTRYRLGLLGSPVFHIGLLLVMLAAALRALFAVDAAVDVLEGETLALTAQAWPAQWPGLMARPFCLSAPVTLQSVEARRYDGGDLKEQRGAPHGRASLPWLRVWSCGIGRVEEQGRCPCTPGSFPARAGEWKIRAVARGSEWVCSAPSDAG